MNNVYLIYKKNGMYYKTTTTLQGAQSIQSDSAISEVYFCATEEMLNESFNLKTGNTSINKKIMLG